MKKFVLLICIVFICACATKKETVKQNLDTGIGQTSAVSSGTEGKKITKWDKTNEEGLNKESIGENNIPENLPKQSEVSITDEIKQDIQNFSKKDIHFDYDDFKIKAEDIPYLESLAQWLEEHPTFKVTIEGHCDERGSDLYNLALGEKRATATKDFLVSLGVNPSRIDCISYGEEKPIDPRHNEAAWAKNRRCHFDIRK